MRRRWPGTIASYILSMVGLLVLWQLIVLIFQIPRYLVPEASKTIQVIVQQWTSGADLWHQSIVTLLETIIGLGLAIVVSVPIAIATTMSQKVSNMIYPVLVISQVVPKVAIAPIAIVWLGTGLSSKILIAFLIAFFVIIVDTSTGLTDIEPDMIHLGRSMGATKLQIYRRIRMPNALPNFFGSLKVAVALALVGAVVGELVGAESGLGYIVTIGFGQFDLPLMFAAVVLMSLIGVILFGAVSLLERIAIPWSRSVRVRELDR